MKMSLCNTFRLFVASLIIVLSNIDTPEAFTLSRTTGGAEPSPNLAKENVSFEVKKLEESTATHSTLKNNDSVLLNTSLSTPGTNQETEGFHTTDTDVVTEFINTQNPGGESQVSSSNSIDVVHVNSTESATDYVTTTVIINETVDEDIYDKNKNEPKAITSNTRKIEFMQNETSALVSQLTDILTDSNIKLDETEITTPYESGNLPTWKKYTTIDRKKQSTTITDDDDTSINKIEEMVKAETKPLRVSLHDTVTSDIPSLEQLKNDLLNSTLKALVSEAESTSEASTEINTSTSPSLMQWDTFESKRAGYLDLSDKVSNERTVVAPEVNVNSEETIRAMFEIENFENDMTEEKTGNRVQSQSQLNDDVIKEELLKEKLINENANRFDPTIQPLPDTDYSNYTSTQTNTSNELSVKPISSEKAKNITLYAVNPNYKPLKKIEVQAPKQFVRDPDDNSWRNESLSSLGIVFKPKNSSKPFTQVLKNKTETEWNSLSEKDNKNDIPDLKERLQKMTEMRKSKRKKIDSFGNTVYFDYEENSSSGEHNQKDQPLSALTSSEETPTTVDEFSSNTPEVLDVTTPIIFTTEKGRGKVINSYSTRKFRKFFNVPEYYDNSDEEDADYLNMAKIDIKKFTTSLSTPTVPLTTPTPMLTPSTQRSWPFNKLSHTISPERKATVQYFPPLSTEKVNINDYDSNFKFKVNSFTNTEPPKNILPISSHKPLTPDNSLQYKTHNDEKVKSFEITTKPDLDKNFYRTQPPHTTQTEFTLLNNDGNYDRDSYVIRHYKDFLREAAKDNEYDKNIDYVPYTKAPPQDITQTDLITYVTEKAKINMDNEYDYETQFRKDVLQRFVDNFNQNSERYKSEFPILFNNSVIHRDTNNGRDIASSRAFMRGLYNTNSKTRYAHRDSYDPNNDNMTVELSPSYELHYYMPEQEEKEVAVPQPVTLPYQYRL